MLKFIIFFLPCIKPVSYFISIYRQTAADTDIQMGVRTCIQTYRQTDRHAGRQVYCGIHEDRHIVTV